LGEMFLLQQRIRASLSLSHARFRVCRAPLHLESDLKKRFKRAYK
jgi:hypothetical protein